MTLTTLDEFLQPLAASSETLLELSRALAATFVTLSAESVDQFLPTPISESVLRPGRRDYGRQVSHPWKQREDEANTAAAFLPSTCKMSCPA